MEEWISNQPRLKGPTNTMLCHAECGLRPSDLCEWHAKYSKILPPDRMFQVLSYIKQYPRRRQIVSTLHTNDKTVHRVLERIHNDMELLSGAVTDVNEAWNRRTSPNNRCTGTYFAANITGCFDATMIRVRRHPGCYSGHKKINAVRVQAAVDNFGCCIFFTGPHYGAPHDQTAWQDHGCRNILLANGEQWLADRGYCNQHLPEFMTGYKAPPRESLTPLQQYHTDMVGHYRGINEHLFSWIKQFHILGTTYRGPLDHDSVGWKTLTHAINIIMNLSSFYFYRNPRRALIERVNPHIDNFIIGSSQIASLTKNLIDLFQNQSTVFESVANEIRNEIHQSLPINHRESKNVNVNTDTQNNDDNADNDVDVEMFESKELQHPPPEFQTRWDDLVIGQKVKVWWYTDNQFYNGTIFRKTKLYHTVTIRWTGVDIDHFKPTPGISPSDIEPLPWDQQPPTVQQRIINNVDELDSSSSSSDEQQ